MTQKNTKPKLTPIRLRTRHDGWTAEKQATFIEALAETACVDEACARVGMGRTSAYGLRARSDAQSFLIAWEAALGVGIRRLTDAVIGRATNGIGRPVFYKGEVVGERRYYDNRLAMFLLRYHDPARYGKWLDSAIHQRGADTESVNLTDAMHNMMEDATADDLGTHRPLHVPVVLKRTIDEAEWAAEKRRAVRKRPASGRT